MFNVAPTRVEAPDVPVVVSVIAFCFPLNVVQSPDDKAHVFVAEAVGTFNVITGVVVPFATVLLKSVPVVPSVSAATLVTVPVN
jgi:fumarate reductase subunit D